MSEQRDIEERGDLSEAESLEAAPREQADEALDSRREFISRLARTAAAPAVVPLMLTMPTAALA